MRFGSGRSTLALLASWLLPRLAAAEAPSKTIAAPPVRPPTPTARSVVTTVTPPLAIRTVEGITEYRLDNGLQVLLFPDQSKATVTVNITYFVGSRHEGYGESGMAHLLEHMVFKGTPTHPEIWKTLQTHGANFNGTTWFDRTNYYEELPATADNLDFALRLEADRMVNSHIAADDLAKEFSVVRNEFESGENSPGRVLDDKMLSVAFQWHNYGKTTIGSRADIERVPADNLRAFYKKHYQPDNAMLIVAGKFDPKATLALITQYFGTIARPTRKLTATWTQEPIQDGERSVTLRRTGDVALVGLLYHGAAGADPDWIAEDALMDILTNKPAGRLYKALVEKGLATEVSGYIYPLAEPGVMILGAKVGTRGTPEKVREVMTTVVEGIAASKGTAITDDELERWRAKAAKEFELALTETATVGVSLSDWAAMGDWRLFFLTRDRAKTLTTADLKRVAGKFLKQSNRTVGLFLPTATPDRAALAELPDVAAMMKGFKGGAAVAAGETFAATIENVEKRTTRSELPGGLKLALLPKKTKGGAVKVALTLRYGREADLRGQVSASEIITQMLLRGTKKHTFQQLKDQFDRLKAEISFSDGRMSVNPAGVASVRIKAMRENLPAVLTLLAEVLREPAFPKAEFETLRKEALSQLEEKLQDPPANAFKVMLQKLFPAPKDDPRYIPTIKEGIERLKQLRLADVAKLHKDLWGTSHAQLAIVGDFDAAATKALITKTLGDWKSPKPYERIVRPFLALPPSDNVINTPDKQMAFVGVAHPLELRDDDPDYPALLMMNYILGGSADSRLFNRIRQKEGLSYGTFSGLNAFPLERNGYFFAGAICAPANADRAMAVMLEELNKLLKEGAGVQEIADAKKSYAQGWDSNMAEDEFLVGELVQGLYLGRTFAYWKDINDKIQKLTAADVTAAARRYIQPAKLSKVKAGDLKPAAESAPPPVRKPSPR